MTGSYYTHKQTGIRKIQEERVAQNFNDVHKNDQNQVNIYSFVVAWQMFNDYEKPDVSKSERKITKDRLY